MTKRVHQKEATITSSVASSEKATISVIARLETSTWSTSRWSLAATLSKRPSGFAWKKESGAHSRLDERRAASSRLARSPHSARPTCEASVRHTPQSCTSR